MAAHIKVYRTYRYLDKDPVIDEIRTLVQDEGLSKKLEIVHQLSGVSTSTLVNWFDGGTKSPQNRTICAVTSALGFKRVWEKERELNIEKELKVAQAWAKQEENRKAASEKRRSRKSANGHARMGATR